MAESSRSGVTPRGTNFGILHCTSNIKLIMPGTRAVTYVVTVNAYMHVQKATIFML